MKTGGRQQGTTNIITRELRIILKQIVANELQQLQTTMQGMEPEKRVEVILKLIPYVLPKVEPVAMEKNEPTNYWEL